MKNVSRILLLVILTASLTSCEKIKSWFDVDVDTTLEGQMNVVSDNVELKSTEAYSLNGTSDPIDLSNNEDLAEYEDLIKAVEAHSVYLEVESIDSTGVIIFAGAEFRISSSEDPVGISWSIDEDWPINANTYITLDADDYTKLNDMLESDATVIFSSTGSCNKGNVHIVLTYGIEVTVTANPS